MFNFKKSYVYRNIIGLFSKKENKKNHTCADSHEHAEINIPTSLYTKEWTQVQKYDVITIYSVH